MKVYTVIVGDFSCNCYIIVKNNKCLIIDPGDDFLNIKNKINELKVNVVGILVTHSHFDHIGALNLCEKQYNLKQHKNIIGINSISCFNFETIETKGHTNDSVSFYFRKEKLMFTGDFLFKDSIGRCDFENSNIEDMKKSLRKIKSFDKDIIIYPGHGSFSKLEYEFKNNFFLKNND